MEMTTKQRDDGITWVTLRGTLDLWGSHGIDVQFHAETAARQRPAVVDISGVDVIVSLGIGMILACALSLKRHGARLVLLGPVPAVEDVLLRCRVDELVSIVRTEDDAIALLQSLSTGAAAGPPPDRWS
jgi:anti-anti-sigma factor